MEVGCSAAGGVKEGLAAKNLFPPTDPPFTVTLGSAGAWAGPCFVVLARAPPPLVLAPLEVG